MKYTTGREVEGDDDLNVPKRSVWHHLGPRGVLGRMVIRKMGDFFLSVLNLLNHFFYTSYTWIATTTYLCSTTQR